MRRPPRERGALAFVVQKHKATSLHYDFRLEMGGVMPSWSIPKGPTLDNKVRRLAMPTPDHDMEYRHFEGTIGSGRHGAGTVMIWDEGTYNPETESTRGEREEVKSRAEAERVAAEGLRDGNLKFRLYGKKLHGSFALVRTRGLGGSGREAWLLIKHRDKSCIEGWDAGDYDHSATTKRTMAQIASEGTATIDSFGPDANPSRRSAGQIRNRGAMRSGAS